MAAEALAGWEPPGGGGPVHWLDVHGRPACTPDGEPRPIVGLSPWRASAPQCEACRALTADLEATATRWGMRLMPLYRYPG